MKEQIPILHKYLHTTDKGSYFLNTMDIGIDLDSILHDYSGEEVENEIKTFLNLPIERIESQKTGQSIINEIVEYSLK